MKNSYKTFFSSTLFSFAFFIANCLLPTANCLSQPLSVTANNNATTLAGLLAGPGVTITNASINCANGASGTFNGATSNIGITNGVLLTSGSVNVAPGPNNSSSAGVNNGVIFNDPDLIAIDPTAYYDPCILEFDAVPTCTTMSFTFVFGSEEYHDYVNSACNDVFGIFVTGQNPSGPAYNNYNMALIPATATPISINNVNNGYSLMCNAGGPCMNCAYFVDNCGGATVQYDGFTVAITVNLNVVACASYHLKLAISDACDGIYDSGVFFKGASLTCNTTALLATTSSTPAICGSNNGSASVNASGGTGPYTYLWSPSGGNSSSATGLSAGNYTVTVTDATGCFSTTATVTVASTGSLALSSNQTNATCFGGNTASATATVTSGNPAYTYAWSNAQTTSTATGLSAGNYSVVVTDGSGCSSSLNFTITQPTAVNATTGSTNEVCGQSNGTATVNPSGGTPGYNYLWSNGQTTPTATGLASGNYSVTVTDANGCTFSIAVAVNSTGGPSATTNSTNETCNQSNGTATANPSGGNPAYTYLWSNGQNAQTATGLAAGNYTVTVTDAGGCAFTVTVTVNMTGGPTATAGADVSMCMGNSTQLNAGGGGNYSWIPATALSNAAISNPIANPNTTTTYTVIVTDVNGCTSADNVTVTINALPVANAGTDPSICSGFSATLNGSGGGSYAWSPATNLSSTNISNPVANPNATTTYTLTVTDANGCTNSDDVTVTVNALPVANFSSTTACFNSPTMFTDLSTGNPTSWNWSFPNAIPSSSTSQNPAPTYIADGTYTATLTVTNANGCQDITSMTVTVNPLPFANFSSTPVCVGTPSCFNDLTTISSGTITGWSWNFGDPSCPNNISNVQSPCHTYCASGIYTVILTATSSNGCQSTTNLQATVNAVPVAAFTASNVCLNALTVFANGSTNAVLWAWDFGDTNTSTQQNPSHTYLAYGTYIVTLIATSGAGCADTIMDTLTVYPLPVVNFAGDSVCVGEITSFTDLSFIPSGNISTWNWNFDDPASGGNNTSTLQNPTHIFTASGNYNVTLTTASNNGCVSSLTIQVMVHPLPVADFSIAPALTLGLTDFAAFTDLSLGNVVQWYWLFGDGDSSAVQNPSHLYSDTGAYIITLAVVSNYGCVDTIMHTVRIADYAFFIPNSFTPNDDGINDFFFGVGIGIVEYEMVIFDRWGNRIFYCKMDELSLNMPCQWDGKVDGGFSNTRVQQDVYVWKIHLTNVFDKKFDYVGTVTVVK